MIPAGLGPRRTVTQRILRVQLAADLVNGLFDRSILDSGSVRSAGRHRSYLQRTLLGPLGMRKSGFEPTAALRKDLAAGLMWS